jgi:hypothetical protein
MTAVGGALWLGTLLGVGAALPVGPGWWCPAPPGRAARPGLVHGASAVAFLCFAVTLVARDVLPRLG